MRTKRAIRVRLKAAVYGWKRPLPAKWCVKVSPSPLLKAARTAATRPLTDNGRHGRSSFLDAAPRRKPASSAFAFGPSVQAMTGPEGDQPCGLGHGSARGPGRGAIAHCQTRCA